MIEKIAAAACVLLASGIAAQAIGSPSYDIVARGEGAARNAPRVAAAQGGLALVFERIAGAERFASRGRSRSVTISPTGFVVAWPTRSPARFAAVAMGFAGASPTARIEGDQPQPTRVYRIGVEGTPGDTTIPTFGRVRVAGVRPNVDVVFYGHDDDLEYDVVVQPGGDPRSFVLRPEAGTTATLDSEGNVLLMRDGEIAAILRRPIAYQLQDSGREIVDCAFEIARDGDVSVHVAAYDAQRALVIDPVVSYATYLGGAAFEQATGIAVDAAGNAYVAGYTMSRDFPTVASYDRSLGKSPDVDVFVSKLNAAGTALVWSTYLGGTSSIDRAVAIAVDAAGSAYVTGHASGNNFPVSVDAWQKGPAGGGSFVAKLAPAGNAIAYSTYIAGVTTAAIAVDTAGSAWVAGVATPALATTSSALQPTALNTTGTGFIVKLNATGSAPLYATFLGGSSNDEINGIAVDAAGTAVVGGATTSDDFPLVDSRRIGPGGGRDGFIARLDAGGGRLLYSTRIGGTLDDSVNAVAIGPDGSAYVVGETYSADFPSKAGFQMHKSGSNLIGSSTGSAFVARMSHAGDGLDYSSFLGGEVCLTPCRVALGSPTQYRADAAYAVAVDAAGHAFVGGIARSYTFPLVDSTATRKRDDTDDSAFIAEVGASGSTLLWSTFVRTGFNEADNKWTRFPPGAVSAIALDSDGAAYVAADADLYSDFQPTAGAFQTTTPDHQGGVIIKFSGLPPLMLATSRDAVETGQSVALTATLAGGARAGDVTFLDAGMPLGTAPLSGNAATLMTTLPVGIHPLTALLRSVGSVTDTPVLFQVVNTPLQCN